MKYDLITTSLHNNFAKDINYINLGEWCNIKSDGKYQKNGHKTLRYIFDERELLNKKQVYLVDLYESYLGQLKHNLNQLHNTSYNIKFWRILIGPWLKYFIDIIYERYNCINFAYNNYNIINTKVFNYKLENCAPQDFSEFRKEANTDEWNHIIFSEIIKFQSRKFARCSEEIKIKRQNNKYLPRYKKIIKKILIYFNKLPINKNIYTVNSLLGYKDLIKLHLKLKQFPNLFDTLVKPIGIKNRIYDKKLRAHIVFQNHSDEFNLLLNNIIKFYLPKDYIENFNDLKKSAMLNYPKKTNVIYTANAYSYDEVFKYWVARSVTKSDSKFIIAQHGGRSGISKYLQSQDHQIAIADKFLSWGWKNDSSNKIDILSSYKLSKSKKNLKYEKNGNILIIQPTYFKYFYCNLSMPHGPQWLSHLKDQILLIKNLEKNIQNKILVRKAVRNNQIDVNRYFELYNLKNIKFDKYKSFTDSANNSRLCIVTDNSTILLECMTANFPTIIYWDKDYYELSSEAEKIFDSLSKCGIFHYSYTSAATKINEIHGNISSWWNCIQTQEARIKFCKKYCYSNENWLLEWSNYFTKLDKN